MKPTVASRPCRLKLSLREMGRPWRGPTGVFVLAKSSSRRRAVWIARSKQVSAKQLVYKLLVNDRVG